MEKYNSILIGLTIGFLIVFLYRKYIQKNQGKTNVSQHAGKEKEKPGENDYEPYSGK